MPEHQSNTQKKVQQEKQRSQTPNIETSHEGDAPLNAQDKRAPHVKSPAHLLQLQRTVGNAAVQRLLKKQSPTRKPEGQPTTADMTGDVSSSPDEIQRAFQPFTVTGNAHLRNDNAWNVHVGNRIDSGSEIVADTAQQKTQNRRFRSNVSWTKAVNVTSANWTAANMAATTYIRSSKVGAAKNYPQQADIGANKPPNRANIERARLNWHELTGEFVEIETSVSNPGFKIAKHQGTYKSIDPVAGTINALDADEQRQVDSNVFEAYLLAELERVIRAAIGGLPWENLLVTPANLRKIMFASGDGSKALRWDNLGKTSSGDNFLSYYEWVMDPGGPFQRISAGATYVRNALEHWRQWLNPPNGNNVTITEIKLSGSDLHEHGLGVMFLKFNKPLGGPPEYNAAGTHEMVFKPEDRELEEGMFGTQNDSLANYLNTEVGLAGNDQITTYKQKVAPGLGTLCEKVVATQAKDLPQGMARPLTQGIKESLMFVLMTGLTDLHGENILWDAQNRPFMIDADNALKLKFMTPGEATPQNGYRLYSNTITDQVLQNIYAGAVGYETAILDALSNPSTREHYFLLDKVKQIFAASTGRTVPIETAAWGRALGNFISLRTVGVQGAGPVAPGATPTKWQWCEILASRVPKGKNTPGLAVGTLQAPGLEGEVGVRDGGNGNFNAAAEAAQLFADFKAGQIPFYNYEYGSGHVLHNNQVIWHGQTINERMRVLFRLFPRQVNLNR